MPNQLVSPRSEIVSCLRVNGGHNTEHKLADAAGLTREETSSVVDAMVREGLVEIVLPRGRWGRIVRVTTTAATSSECDGYSYDLDCPVDEDLEEAARLLDEIEQCKSRLAAAEQAFRDYAEEFLYRRVADYRA